MNNLECHNSKYEAIESDFIEICSCGKSLINIKETRYFLKLLEDEVLKNKSIVKRLIKNFKPE